MSTVLAIDTSTSQTCVALVENGKVLFNKSHLDLLAHGEVLPKLVAQALKVNSKIDLVAVGMGPGPFTFSLFLPSSLPPSLPPFVSSLFLPLCSSLPALPSPPSFRIRRQTRARAHTWHLVCTRCASHAEYMTYSIKCECLCMCLCMPTRNTRTMQTMEAVQAFAFRG